MEKTFKKLNITIKNFERLDKVIELDNKLEVYKENIIQFVIYDKSIITAHGNSSISAYDNSNITSYDNSTIYAYNNSIVFAHDNSTITACDNSTISACAKSTIYAYNNSTVFAHDNSNITAYNNSTIIAWDNSSISSYDKSNIIGHSNSSISSYDKSNIIAYGNSTITAYEKSNITGRDNSTINAHDNSNIIAYDNSSIYADGNSVVSAYGKSNITLSEFSFLTHNSTAIKITKNNWFGAEIKQVFKVKKDIVVFKKLKNDLICELLLKKGQVFQSENHSKCRTNKAVVLKIYDRETKEEHQTGFSRYDKAFEYKVGKEINSKYDKRIMECSKGIHFYLTRDEAEKY